MQINNSETDKLQSAVLEELSYSADQELDCTFLSTSVPHHTESVETAGSRLPRSPAELRCCGRDARGDPSRSSAGFRTRLPALGPSPPPLGWSDTPAAPCSGAGPSARVPPAPLCSGPRDRGRGSPDAHRPGHDGTGSSPALSEEEEGCN